MRFALYLPTALLLWPLLLFALPLPPCLDLDFLSEDGVNPCEPIEHDTVHWSLDEGRSRRRARSAEDIANADAVPALKQPEDIVEHAIIEPEGPMRSDVESTLSIVGKEGPIVDSRATRKHEERWMHGEFEALEVVDVDSPEEFGDADAPPWPNKRWDIHGGDLIPTPPEPVPDS